MSSGSGAGAEETPPSVVPEGSSTASAIAGEFPLSDKAGQGLIYSYILHVCSRTLCAVLHVCCGGGERGRDGLVPLEKLPGCHYIPCTNQTL